MPGQVWQDIFERQWKSSRHLWDRKIFVMGDTLRLVTTANEFGDKLDWVEQVIKETNKTIGEYNLRVQKEEQRRIESNVTCETM